ncbi:hypothetical protein [Fibrella arboris]|uniref:hypothetical protein n=1 Tax=Fibrella arboris TaxID=3242486 RepID=UPI003521D948
MRQQPYRIRLCYALTFWLMLLASQQLVAQKRTVPKKNKPMLVITHPVSRIRLTFQEPALLEKTGAVAAWRKLTIKLPDDEFTVDAGSADGYMVDPSVKAERSWSPDGKYIALYRAYSIGNKQTMSGISLIFLNLEYGEEVDFQDKNGNVVNKDTFTGWLASKPHTIRRGTAKAETFTEAYATDESAKLIRH